MNKFCYTKDRYTYLNKIRGSLKVRKPNKDNLLGGL